MARGVGLGEFGLLRAHSDAAQSHRTRLALYLIAPRQSCLDNFLTLRASLVGARQFGWPSVRSLENGRLIGVEHGNLFESVIDYSANIRWTDHSPASIGE
jgi:hypothetical protein